MLVEPPFLGLTTGRKEMMLPNGDHYDENLGRFYTSHMKLPNLTEKSASNIFQPYWEEYKRTVIEDVWFLKPDVFEFLAVSGLILWDTGKCALLNSRPQFSVFRSRWPERSKR